MSIDGAALLAGPRGRSLCIELARRLDPRVGEALFDLAFDADVAAGASVVRFGIDEHGQSFQDRGPIANPRYSLSELAARIGAATSPALLAALDADDIGQALQRSVDLAAYWQPPRGEGIVAAAPVVQAALAPLADTVVAHSSTQWWRRARSAEQWAIEWDPIGEGAPFDPIVQSPAAWTIETRDEEATALRERPADPTARWSGSWWSLPWRGPKSTGATPDGTPVGISLVEDSMGWKRALALPVRGGGTTLEIDSAEDWAALCERFPLEVTASRRHDWYRVTGHTGTWIIPDWARVAEHADAVHLSVWAYLTASGRAVSLESDRATMIAGFGPDVTAWLTGRVREVEGPRVHWQAVEPTADREQRWVRQSPRATSSAAKSGT